MTGHTPAFRPMRWFLSVVAALACVLLMVAGRSWFAVEEQKHEEPMAKSSLERLNLEGHELHASLRTPPLEVLRDVPTNAVQPTNPHLSTDDDFVESISRGASQGRLAREGIRAALYARYATDENEIGVYGLEADSVADADQREKLVRDIWAHNASFGRSRVHRGGLLIVVVWHDGVSTEIWEAVNTKITEQLNASGSQ